MSEVVAVLLKDPDEVLTLSTDWSGMLADGETISGTPAWAVEDAAAADATPLAAIGSDVLSGTVASRQVQAGTKRQVYRVRCRMTTSTGQIYDRSWSVRIASR